MTLPEQFERDLAACSTTGPGVVATAVAPRRLRCEFAESTPLAVGFDVLELATDELASATVDKLQAVSKDLASRVTYLLEPIGPIEIDADKCVVQMRSIPPQKNESGHNYYELLVERGGALSLRRFEKTPANPRQPISATVTREVLGRLVADFCAAIDAE